MKLVKTLSALALVLFLAAGLQASPAQTTGQAQPAVKEPPFRPALLGQPFPSLSLSDYDGKKWESSGLKGKNVVLIVLRVYAGEGRWCTICNYQYADAVDAVTAQDFRGKYNAEVLFLFPFGREVVSEFLALTPSQLEKIRGWKNPAEPEKLDAQGRERLERMRWLFSKDLSMKEGEVPRPIPLLLDPERQLSKSLGVFSTDWNGVKVEQGIPSVFILDGEGILRFKYIGQTTADRPSFDYLGKILEILAGK